MAAVFTALFVCASGFAQGDLIDKVVAVVGNEIILQSEVEIQALQSAQGGEVTGNIRAQTLEGLLFEKLLINQARLDSVEVDEERINQTIDQRINYYVTLLGSEEAFEEYYGKTVTAWREEFHDPIKEQLMAQDLQQMLFGGASITPGEVVEYFEAIPKDSLPLIPEELWYSQIASDPIISIAQEIETRNALDSIRQKVMSGTSMNLAAAKHSEDPGSKYNGGCYDFVPKGTMVSEYEAAVFSTPIGGYSEVFETEFGYHFVYVEDKRGNRFKACHILMRPQVTDASLILAENALDSLVTAIRTDSLKLTFKEAAITFSTDENTSKQEGRVINPASGTARFRVDEVDPKLFFIIDKLQVGDISDPFYFTKADGSGVFYAIRLDGRLPAHTANLDDDYLIFQSQAAADREQTQLEAWVRKKLIRTYVRIDDEYASLDYTFPWLEFQNTPEP